MVKRALFVAAAAAVFLPLAAAPAQASCLDDARTGLEEGYVDSPKSQYWNEGHVQWTGTATFHIHGDAAAADYTAYAGDTVFWVETIAGNAPGVTTEFVDCVAG